MEFQKLQKIIAEVLSIDDTDIVQEMKNVRSVPDETGKIIRVSEKNRI